MLIELIRPTTPDLARRWIAALLMAPADEREAIVQSVESRMLELYDDQERARAEAASWLHISGPEVQKDGYTERIERSYEVKTDPATREGHEEREAG